MGKRVLAVALSCLLMPGLGLAAAESEARYELQRSGDRFVRLDKQTGAMSICEERNGDLACRMAADERSAFEDELDRLETRLEALEKKVNGTTLPSESEIDRSLGIMERFFRTFMGIIREFRNDEPSDALPQKT